MMVCAVALSEDSKSDVICADFLVSGSPMAYTSDDDDMGFPHQRFQHPNNAEDVEMSSDTDSELDEVEVLTLAMKYLLFSPMVAALPCGQCSPNPYVIAL